MEYTFTFTSGRPALDFVGTLQRRRKDAPVELLTSPDDLDSWFRESGVAPGSTSCRPSDVEQAVALREAIHSLVTARIANDSFGESALVLVNLAARNPPAIPQLTAVGRQIEASPEQALSSVARDAIDILSGPEGRLLKECARPGCTQVYIDHSRGARREWCAMDPCGNNMKAAAYRARKRSAVPVS